MSGPRTLSLCTGYAGLDAAASTVLGGDLAYVADIDPAASALLAHRFPGVPNLGDIKAVDWLSLSAVDLLLAGYSCQPFSQAGRRLGTEDPRHVWPYVAKAIGALRPGLVILENVFGHLTLGFDVVLADLAALGYDAEWVVVTASAAGACHRRARLFILAFPAGRRPVTGGPVAVLRDRQWLQPCESLFGMLPFTGRIPPSGSMAGGRVYAATDGPSELAAGMLKTPTAQLAVNGGSQHPDKRRAGGHGPTLADQVEHELLPTPMAADGGWAGDADGKGARASSSGYGLRNASREISRGDHLLPTPAARDGKGRDMPGREGGKSLPETLLPTPRATDGEKGGPNQRGSSGDLMLPSAVMQFLPTPSAADASRGHNATRGGDRHGEPLLAGVSLLLPTPTAQDAANARHATANRSPGSSHHAGTTLCDVFHESGAMLPTPTVSGSHGTDRRSDGSLLLPGVAREQATDWGPYEAAIRRWEAATGRPAPDPTVPGKTGRRLNPALPEWMMGLPEGWITDVPGLSRNAMLRLAGNGVVPAQAVLALRILLDRAGLESLESAA